MSHAHVYILVDGEHMVANDVVYAFELMLFDSLWKDPYKFKRSATITRPMALTLAKRKHSSDGLYKMLNPALQGYSSIEVRTSTTILLFSIR